MKYRYKTFQRSLKRKKRALLWGIINPAYGIHDPTRGEGVWAANVARLLRRYGYNVVVYAKPFSLAYKSDQEGIIYRIFDKEHEVPTERFDLYFHFSLQFNDEPEHWKFIRPFVRQRLFGTWYPHARPLNTPFNTNIITPYKSYDSRIYTVPFTWIDKFPEPKFSNKTIVWTGRHPFHTSIGDNWYKVNLWHLEATLEALKRGFKAIFFHSQYMFVEDSVHYVDPWLIETAKDTFKAIVQTGRAELHETMPRDQFLHHLQKGSIALICTTAGAAPEVLTYGLVPLTFREWHRPFMEGELIEKFFGAMIYDQVSRELVFEKVFKLLEDEWFYLDVLTTMRRECPIYETKEALNLLSRAINA